MLAGLGQAGWRAMGRVAGPGEGMYSTQCQEGMENLFPIFKHFYKEQYKSNLTFGRSLLAKIKYKSTHHHKRNYASA
jgi:hypothetical protein